MSRSSIKRRALVVVVGLAGLAAAVSSSHALAFHFGGGGFGHAAMPHFGGGGGGFRGVRPSFAHFGGGDGYHPRGPHLPGGGRGPWPRPIGGHYPVGDRGPQQPRGPRWPHTPHLPNLASRCVFAHECGPHGPPRCIDHCGPQPPVGPHCGVWNHWCHPYPPIVHHCGPWNRWCQWPQPPIVVGGGGTVPPPAYGGSGPSYSAAPAPVSAPQIQPASTSEPKICVPGGTYVAVVFQPNVTSAAITAFLKDYSVTMADGPNADGIYRLRLSTETQSPDQFKEMIDSMRGRTDIVASVG